MENIFNNLSAQAQSFGPKLITAAIILLVAFIIAKLVSWERRLALRARLLSASAGADANGSANSLRAGSRLNSIR